MFKLLLPQNGFTIILYSYFLHYISKYETKNETGL